MGEKHIDGSKKKSNTHFGVRKWTSIRGRMFLKKHLPLGKYFLPCGGAFFVALGWCFFCLLGVVLFACWGCFLTTGAMPSNKNSQHWTSKTYKHMVKCTSLGQIATAGDWERERSPNPEISRTSERERERPRRQQVGERERERERKTKPGYGAPRHFEHYKFLSSSCCMHVLNPCMKFPKRR